VQTGVGKPDPRTFDPENPQPDPIHAIDPSRIDYSKPQAPVAQRMKHTATDPEKMIEEREAVRNRIIDEDDADEDLMLAPSPMEETVERYREPGMAYGFMSDNASRTLGLRGYQPVMDERGDPVKLGTLTLGKIPERIQRKRLRKGEKESTERVQSMSDEYGDAVNRLKAEGKDLGLRVLAPGEMTGDFTNTETGRTVRIG
jgi:hypothetical protein